jgi:polygalacturonase
MKRNLVLALSSIFVFDFSSSFATSLITERQSEISSIAVKSELFNITSYGAIGNGKVLNTTSIQKAIDVCAQKGGGTIVIPKGIFLTGSIFLKKGVNIYFEDGAVLKGSTDINHYPKVNTRIEGHFEPWRVAIINGDAVDNLSITGNGTIDGSGAPFWKEFYERRDINSKTTNLNVERPRIAFIQNSKNVKISGIHFKDSGFWNLHVYKCKDVLIENCRFTALNGKKPNNAPSSDGIDIDSSQDVIISKCFFSVGDDCIALKGTKGPFAMQDVDSPPVERIQILDCTFEAGGGIVTFGSEASIIRDIKVERCTTTRPTVLRIKLRPDTPQIYENISVNDITVKESGMIFKVEPWRQYFDLKGQEAPQSLVRNIRVTNVNGAATTMGNILGHDKTTFENILVKDVDITLTDGNFDLSEIKNFKFENVKVNGKLLDTPVANK